MVQRLTTTLATFTSAAWTPAADTILQADFASITASPLVRVQTQLNAAAAWKTVAKFYPRSQAFMRVTKLPTVRLVVERNEAGVAFNVYDSE